MYKVNTGTNWENICRLCLLQTDSLFAIFDDDSCTNDSNQLSLSSKIMACVSIEVSLINDGPNHICDKCLNSINGWLVFKQTCNTANIFLHQYLEDHSKINYETYATSNEATGVENLNTKGSSVRNEGQKDAAVLKYCSPADETINEEGTKQNLKSHSSERKPSAKVKNTIELTVDTTKGYTCEICNSTYSHFVDLLQHDETSHPLISADYCCSICKHYFISRNRLVTHTNVVHNEKLFKCSLCSELFLSEKLVRNHFRKSHSKKVTKKFTQQCAADFEEIVDFPDTREHTPNSQVQEKENVCETKPTRKGYHCELCQSAFKYFTDLLVHDESAHPSVYREHCCLICRRLFISDVRRSMHYKLVHKQKSFRCSVCDKLFVSKKSLSVHHRLHLGKYSCEQCDYVTTSKLYLSQHLLKHQGREVSFTCDICQKSFSQRSSLLRHQNLHLKNQGKCFRCSVCGSLSRTRSQLLFHMNTHNASSMLRSFICNVCDKGYTSRKVLLVHLRTHISSSEFNCTTCKKNCRDKHELVIHEQTHSNVKMFSCFHCGKKFCYKNTILRHLKKCYPRVRSDMAI